jgi:PAS domain S-box-containing protein
MGERIRAFDWRGSSLGEPAAWPAGLRTALRILLTTQHPVFIFWGPRHVCFYNDAYALSLGPEKHPSMLGATGRDAWAEIWEIIGPQIERVLGGGGPTWHENHLVPITRHGRREDVYWTYSYGPIDEETASSGIGGVLVLCTETTRQVRNEQRLRESEGRLEAALQRVSFEKDRLRELYEQAPGFMAVLRGPEHVFEIANAAYRRLVGDRDVVGRTLLEALPELAGQAFPGLLDQVYASGEPIVREGERALLAGSDGATEERFVDFVYQPIREVDGSISGIFVQGSEVTARTQIERRLRESEGRFRAAVAAVEGVVWTNDAAGAMRGEQLAWAGLTGQSYDEYQEFGWTSAVHQDDVGPTVEAWLAAVRERRLFEFEHRVRRHDGEWRRFSIRATPVLGADGELREWVGVHTDVTERHAAQQRLASLAFERTQLLEAERAARSEAEAANRVKDEFLATLSHELRTPLSVIVAWGRVLLRKHAGDSESLRQGLQLIVDNGIAQSELITDLLDMSRIVSGKFTLETRPLDLVESLRSAVAAQLPAAEAKGVALELEPAPIDVAIVNGDATRLGQVFANLLTNAIKFTPAGGAVSVALVARGGTFEVTVNDSGEGIAPEFLPRLFDRFRQADSGSARRHGGLGLGLSIVKQLAEMHGGQVRAQSAGPGRGACFTVTLPAAEQAAWPDAAGPTPALGEPATLEGRSLAGLRILAVEDEPSMREYLVRVLEEHGAKVAAAPTAARALEILDGARGPGAFDVLVSDIGLSGTDGYQLLAAARQMPGGDARRLPAIALTAFARVEDRQRILLAGFQAHLGKPYQVAQLVAVVNQLGRAASSTGGSSL